VDGAWIFYKPYWTNESVFMVSSREIPASCISNLEEKTNKQHINFNPCAENPLPIYATVSPNLAFNHSGQLRR